MASPTRREVSSRSRRPSRRHPKTTPSTPSLAAWSRSSSMTRASQGAYSKSPPRGRTMHMTVAPRAWHSSTAARITPCEGVVPPTARLSHSSMRRAPAAMAASTRSRFSAQNSRTSPVTAPIKRPLQLRQTLPVPALLGKIAVGCKARNRQHKDTVTSSKRKTARCDHGAKNRVSHDCLVDLLGKGL